MSGVQRTCPWCGENVTGHPQQVYCKKQCAGLAAKSGIKHKQPCAFCGIVARGLRSTKKYCSLSCKRKYVAKQNREANQLFVHKDSKMCPICGRGVVGRWWLKIYCGVRCREKARGPRPHQKYTPAKPRTIACKICNKEFQNVRPAKYCSNRCRWKHRRDRPSAVAYRKKNRQRWADVSPERRKKRLASMRAQKRWLKSDVKEQRKPAAREYQKRRRKRIAAQGAALELLCLNLLAGATP